MDPPLSGVDGDSVVAAPMGIDRPVLGAFASLVLAAVPAAVLTALGIARAPIFSASFLYDEAFFAGSMVGAFFVAVLTARDLRERGAASVLGVFITLIIAPFAPDVTWLSTLHAAGVGLGVGALVVVAARLRRPAHRAREARRLLAMLALPLFVALSLAYLALTVTLFPATYDGTLFARDLSFGVDPSFDLGVALRGLPSLRDAALVVYKLLPVWLALTYAFRERRDERPFEAIAAFLWAALFGYLAYLLVPVAGPRYVFAGYPVQAPPAAQVPLRFIAEAPVPRNAMPSLHTAWALLVFWHTRPLGRWVRLAGGLALGLTLIATVGFGYHYLLDLVVAVPFSLGVEAVVKSHAPVRRRQVAAASAALGVALWLALIFWGGAILSLHPIVPWTLVLVTVLACVHLERGLWEVARAPIGVASVTTRLPRRLAALAAIFFVSGAAALVYQVVFAKSLSLTFGSTGRARTVVLATYMAGLALGSWVGGKLAERLTRLVRAYALTEVGVALWCALGPLLLLAGQAAYVALAHGSDPGAGWLVWLQLLVGAALLMPPTFLMGLTLPLLVRHFGARDQSLGSSVSTLYAANTLGAALSALLTGYLLLPRLGVSRSFAVGVLLNLGAAFASLRLAKEARSTNGGPSDEDPPLVQDVPADADGPAPPGQADGGEPRGQGQPAGVTPPPSTRAGAGFRARRLGWAAAMALGLGGLVTFGLEATYTHLLAVVAGNSAYAFSLMLFCFLLGLGAGSAAARRWLRRGLSAALGVGAGQALLALVVLLGVYLWDDMAAYFASFADYPAARTFPEREFVRFAVCAVLLLPPALLIGGLYPLAMELVGRSWPEHEVRALGRVAALNTVGNVLGALVAGFWWLPALGSLTTLRSLAAVSVLLALVVALAAADRDRRVALVACVVAAVAWVVGPTRFDQTALASGANVYFQPQPYGRAIDHVESLDGGLTTVARSQGREGRPVLTLLTNGKFQGDDSGRREMAAQSSFALAPLLHTTARDRALVIGYGTGVSADVVQRSGFARVDVAELSRDILTMTERHFARVNGGVLHRPNVHTYVTDGRNLLLLSEDRYSLISMEISSIWFAGASSLYNREFYQLVADHLAPSGVLQQWLQLHHISPLDIARVLTTVHEQFAQVYLYYLGRQGIIVACKESCPATAEAARALAETPTLASTLNLLGGDVSALSRGLLLDTAGVEAMTRAVREVGYEDLVATDDNLLLEYSTPRGNVHSDEASRRRALMFLHRFGPPTAADTRSAGSPAMASPPTSRAPSDPPPSPTAAPSR